jgi:glycosyltransferase involved in cell wall biosynthesis
LLERATLPIAIRRCGALVAISESTRTELVERFPRSASEVAIAHPAADARFTPNPSADDEEVLRRHGLRRPYALVTGTLEPRKNLPRVIQAFAALDGGVRDGWTLALAGAPGWETESTFASASAHSDLVRTLGYVADDELASLYRQADLFCYVSLYEGFGIPVLEAMQSGTAVLTSSVSSMPEVGGDAVAYAHPLDQHDIERAMAELLGDADLRARLAARGIVRAKRFDWDESARRVLDVLEGLRD